MTGAQRGEGLKTEGVDESIIVDVAGQHELAFAGLAGDGAGPGVVLAGSGLGVTSLVITELGEHPGAEHDTEAGLAEVDLSVRVLAKMGADLRQQYAEKLHVLTRLYETGDSTRVRDLVDLVLLAEDGVSADAELVRRVHHVFAIRRTHAVPEDLPAPPAAWTTPYVVLAAEIGLSVTTPTEAHKIVSQHWRRARAS